MKILVTGGSGFLGARLIPELVRQGHDVPALARSAASSQQVGGLGATPIAGDLEDGAGLILPQIDAVVHAAAYFHFTGAREPYLRANVEGTRTLLAAARKAGAETFVYVSAAGVVMDDKGSPVHDVDERAPTFPDSFSAYLASKAQGESLALAANMPGFRALAIRPPAIWGPGDPFSRQLPEAISSGRFAFIDRGAYPFDTCHVDNVVEGAVRALGSGEGGRAYFIKDNETATFREFVAMLASRKGLSIEKLSSIPYPIAFLLGHLMEIGAAIRRSQDDPPLSRSMVRMIGREFTVSDAAAKVELGYRAHVSRAMGIATYER
jgi:nucleoside-diphosphate-sugar epimerase